MDSFRPARVAIIGGGCAAMTAAFQLTRPELNGRYLVTVYQLGWRLGGKGASGRGSAGRIEEHGLHLWMGSYENAFRMMRECYAELGRDPRRYRIAGWQDAFFPAPFVGLTERAASGAYWTFLSYFPPADGLPGDDFNEHDPFTVSFYVMRAATIIRSMLIAIQARRSQKLGAEAVAHRPSESRPRGSESTSDPMTRMGVLLKLGALATTAGMIEAAGILETLFALASQGSLPPSLPILETMAATARRQLEALVEDDPELLLLWEGVDISLTSMIGAMRFGLMTDPRGFDAINDYDFRDWMRLNGASERSIESAFMRGAYDLAFAYEDGDYRRPRHAAGVALRGALRMLFSSRGSMFWKMRAGMGDVVFAPLYEVLKRRGVSFQFFHRLERVRLCARAALRSGEHLYVEALEFDIQADLKHGEQTEYEPLIDVEGLPCWPSSPDYSQLTDGDRLRDEGWQFESHWDRRKVRTRTSRVVDDFDFVVLGVGLGAIPHVCQDFLALDQRWRDMVTKVKTVETQGLQIWMKEDMDSLGWKDPPVALSAFVQPFETWSDMGHLAHEEQWPIKPRAIAYFCSVLKDDANLSPSSDPLYRRRRRAEVRANAIHFLNNDIGQLWPHAVRRAGEFRWEVLMTPNGRDGANTTDESLIDSQFWIANVDPTERYVLSLPGTQKYRISPLDETYDNFTIAGDWTACGFDVGCVEAAVMSGMLAAHAISGFPRLRDIVAYDHP